MISVKTDRQTRCRVLGLSVQLQILQININDLHFECSYTPATKQREKKRNIQITLGVVNRLRLEYICYS